MQQWKAGSGLGMRLILHVHKDYHKLQQYCILTSLASLRNCFLPPLVWRMDGDQPPPPPPPSAGRPPAPWRFSLLLLMGVDVTNSSTIPPSLSELGLRGPSATGEEPIPPWRGLPLRSDMGRAHWGDGSEYWSGRLRNIDGEKANCFWSELPRVSGDRKPVLRWVVSPLLLDALIFENDCETEINW